MAKYKEFVLCLLKKFVIRIVEGDSLEDGDVVAYSLEFRGRRKCLQLRV